MRTLNFTKTRFCESFLNSEKIINIRREKSNKTFCWFFEKEKRVEVSNKRECPNRNSNLKWNL
jgi:hypothetical protein